MRMPVFVQRAVVRNYKSIAGCDVTLEPLTLLVGPNGTGKSNFLDALRFVADSLNFSLEHALRDRGGIKLVRRHSRGHPTHFGLRLELRLTDGSTAVYAFEVAAEKSESFSVRREECRVFPPVALAPESYFEVQSGAVVDASCELRTAISSDRLALVSVSALPEFRQVYDGLCGMAFYNLNADVMRDLQEPDPGHVLARHGDNIASVIRELARNGSGNGLQDINEQLKLIVPGLVGVEPKTLGPKETIEFLQAVKGDENPWRFYADSMSDGTVRALGILVAIHQPATNRPRPIRLVGIEEPEVAIHPGAAEVLAEALVSAADEKQIIVTTHSPDLLDHHSIDERQIRAVDLDGGRTIIGPVDTATRSAMRERLYTAGELLRQNQIAPSEEARTLDAKQLHLFGNGTSA